MAQPLKQEEEGERRKGERGGKEWGKGGRREGARGEEDEGRKIVAGGDGVRQKVNKRTNQTNGSGGRL